MTTIYNKNPRHHHDFTGFLTRVDPGPGRAARSLQGPPPVGGGDAPMDGCFWKGKVLGKFGKSLGGSLKMIGNPHGMDNRMIIITYFQWIIYGYCR